jgi:hypothetical protein
MALGPLTAAKVSLLVQDTGNTLRLTWIEEGGPRVRKPETTGFGSRLFSAQVKNATLLFDRRILGGTS